MAILKFKPVLSAILVGSVLLPCNFTEASLVTNKFPMLTYAEQNVPTYDKPNGSRKGFISPGVALVYIKQINPDGWAYGSYPIAGGKRIYRWFQMRELQGYLDFNNTEMTVESDQVVFRTSAGNSRLGSLKKNDKVIVIAERGDSKKIIYRVGGGNEYKMGWLTPASTSEIKNDEPEKEESDIDKLLKVVEKGGKVEIDTLVVADNGSQVTLKQNKVNGTGNQVNNVEGDGNSITNVTAGGNAAVGDGASVAIDSYKDESVNKNAEINSENTIDSYNTADSGNTNISTDSQIKTETVKEDKMTEEKKIPEVKLEGGPAGINNKLGNSKNNDKKTINETKYTTKNDGAKKG